MKSNFHKIVFLFLVFFSQAISAQENKTTRLGEVIVTGKKGNYLYELLSLCRQENTAKTIEAKTYYELQSFVDEQQVELVEGFYNADIAGYDLENLHIKNGRFALQKYHNRTFASLDGCRVFVHTKLFQRNEYFPFSPLELSQKQLKKQYQLQLDSIMSMNEESIWLISFKPYQQTGLYYEGQVWINPHKKQIRQITLHAKTDQYHPFLPLSWEDRILDVEITINKIFKEVGEANYFNTLNFDYVINYQSCPNTEDELIYQIHTIGSLQAYDFENSFSLPHFRFNKADDYFNISAIPYNDFFWIHHEEPVMQNNRAMNEQFYHADHSFRNGDLNFKIDPGKMIPPLIKLFVHWSENRQYFLRTDYVKRMKYPLVIKVKIEDIEYISMENPKQVVSFVTTSDYYNLGIVTFMDIYQYSDTTQIITSTIMDPDQLFYFLEMDRVTECFFNTFFDLVEIKRREFEMQVNLLQNPNVETIQKMYTLLQADIEDLQKEYVRDVQLGFDLHALRAWNVRVKKKLAIDNIEIFKLQAIPK